MTFIIKSPAHTSTWNQGKLIYLFLIIIAAVYYYLIYKNALIIASPAHSAIKLFIINSTVAIPELIIWAIAFISSVGLKKYAVSIENTPDGKGMNYLADAL